MRDFKITQINTKRDEESLSRYLSDIAPIRMIDAKEEVVLANKIKEGDLSAEHRLVTANLRFVVSCAKKYQGMGLGLCDLINEGNLGLIKAAKLYDDTRGFKFISYAVWWVRQSMISALNEYTRVVRVPLNQQLAFNAINTEAQKLEQTLEREPTLEELSEVLDKTQTQLADFIQSNAKVKRLDDLIPGGESDDNCLLSYIPDNSDDQVDDWIRHDVMDYEIGRLLTVLNDREKKIINMSFGMGGYEPMIYEDIAERLNLTRERVRQLRKTAIAKMRKMPKRNLVSEYA